MSYPPHIAPVGSCLLRLTSCGVSVGSVGGVALWPRPQVAPLGVLLALWVGATSVVRRPAGDVALLRVVYPSAGVHQQSSVTDGVTVVVVVANCCAATVHAEMIKART